MTKEHLLQSAYALPDVSPEVVAEYAEKQEKLAAGVDEIMLRQPKLNDLIGADNIDVMKTNHDHHGRFVASILEHPDPELLVDSVLWVFRAYRSHGFQPDYFQVQIGAWLDVMRKDLSSEAFAAVRPLYDWFLGNIPIFTEISDTQLGDYPSMPDGA